VLITIRLFPREQLRPRDDRQDQAEREADTGQQTCRSETQFGPRPDRDREDPAERDEGSGDHTKHEGGDDGSGRLGDASGLHQ